MTEETQGSEKPMHVINCEQYEIVELYEKCVKVIVPSVKEIGFWNNLGNRAMCANFRKLIYNQKNWPYCVLYRMW